MTCIPIPTDLAFTLLDEASRRRALTNDESMILEQIVTRGHQTQRIRITWTAKLDRALWLASHRKGTVRAFAVKHGFSEQACYDRLCKLRKAKAARKAKLPTDGAKG